jgi:hypothetical protein
MVRFVPLGVIAFLVFSVCGALCQQRQDTRTAASLPDAPSAEMSRAIVEEARTPFTADAADAELIFVQEFPRASEMAQLSFAGVEKQKDSGDLVNKYLSASLLKRTINYHPAPGEGLMSRAAYAASSVFVTRDDSGKARLNTSYFVGMLGSALVHTAYRPYWRRSVSEPFSDFGSNIGNDAGMNFLHEFGPGLQQLVKSHAPRFVARIEGRISHN